METHIVKKGILSALTGILPALTVEEIEDVQDALSIQLHQLTDDGKRVKLSDLKKDLDIV